MVRKQPVNNPQRGNGILWIFLPFVNLALAICEKLNRKHREADRQIAKEYADDLAGQK